MMRRNVLTIYAVMLFLTFSGCAKQQTSKPDNDAQPTRAAQPIRISAENTDAAEPAVASASDGSVYVVWVEHQPESKADVWLKKVNPDGSSAGVPARVNQEAGVATAWRGDPPTVAVAGDGTVYVGWTGRIAPKSPHSNLYLSASRDGGKTFERPLKVNDDQKPARHGMHSLAVDKDGRAHLAWLDERNLSAAAPMEKHRGEMEEKESNNEVFTAYSEDGGRTISKNQMIAQESCPCCKTAVTAAPDGRVYVGWRQVLKGDYRHIAVAASADKGKTFSAPVIVSDDQWVIAGCPVSGPALSTGDDGMLRVLWYTEGEAGARGLYVTQSSDGGKAFTARQLVSNGLVRGNPVLLASAGKSFAIWNGGQGAALELLRAEIMPDGKAGNSQTVMSAGELPSAVAVHSQLTLAYITTANKQRSIWLLRSGKDEIAKL